MTNGVDRGRCQATDMRTLTIVSILSVWGLACGDSESPSTNGLTSGAGGSGADAGGGTGQSGEGPGPSIDTSAARGIVFNEVAAVGPSEWIEIANKGDVAVSLGNYFVADSDKTTGEPKKGNAMRFPEGTRMDPGSRIVILASKKNGTVGPHPKADCLPDGPDTCFYAPFGVSATTGESLHLLAPDGSVITSTAMPKTLSADAGGATTQTQCRIPDLTGDFATCAPTPGQPNRTP
jgi:Lamin Tail Domain